MKRLLFIIAGVAGVAGVGLVALAGGAALGEKQAPPAAGPPRPLPHPELTTFELPNHLKVTLVPHGDVPKVTVEVTLRSGTVDESDGELGLASATGELLQQGTTSRDAATLAREAAKMGGELQVGVTADETFMGTDVLGEFAPDAVKLVADLVEHPAFPDSELPRLKTDAAREVAIARSQPQTLAAEKLRGLLYPGHPYGHPLPSPEQIQAVTVEQIRKFHAEHYVAGRAHLYVAGRFDAAAVEQAVRAAFGEWSEGTPARPNLPKPTATRSVHLVDRPGAVQSTVILAVPVPDLTQPDWIAQEVANSLLGGSFASRITSNIREKHGYTYSPRSFIQQYDHVAHWAEFADVTTAVTGPALKEIFGEIDRLGKTAPPAAELRAIQTYVAGTFALQVATRDGIVRFLDLVDFHGLPPDTLDTYVQRVMAVTPEDVRRIVKKNLDPAHMTLVVLGDEKVVRKQLAPFGKIQK